jgi:hypothetical protein
VSVIEPAVRVVLDPIVRGEYTVAVAATQGSRIGAEDLARAIADYGRTLVDPAAGWWSTVAVTELSGDRGFHVAAPLWTAEEGRSDLTLDPVRGVCVNCHCGGSYSATDRQSVLCRAWDSAPLVTDVAVVGHLAGSA